MRIGKQHNTNYVLIYEAKRMDEYARNEIAAACVMTRDSITDYIQHEKDRGASENVLRRCKQFTCALYEWLPDEKIITKDRLLLWRQNLKDIGYSKETELNYIKGINRYLDYMDHSEMRFDRGRPRDIAGMQFGYLTAIEPTGEKSRKDIVWRCQCKCGKEASYPATRLLTGNTLSCGCLRGGHFKEINKYIGGTSLRQALDGQVHSTKAASGYTGVTAKRGKWKAYIKYKGRHIDLGSYDKLEDAVKARARGKELVQADAQELLDSYKELHRDDPALPNRAEVKLENRKPKREQPEPSILPAIRSNNTSGYPGVHKKRDKWAARITFQKNTYQLGSYESIEEAIAVRQEAETQLRNDPQHFSEWIQKQRQSGKQEAK